MKRILKRILKFLLWVIVVILILWVLAKTFLGVSDFFSEVWYNIRTQLDKLC